MKTLQIFLFRLLVTLLALLPSGGLWSQATLIGENRPGPQFIRYILDSPAVGDNQIESNSRVNLNVVLPIDYGTSGDKRYPVVYYLHGHGGDSQEVRGWLNLLNQAFKDGQGFILVGVPGKNNLGGGFYVNSPKTGRWEDFFLKEVVPFIDSALRTIPKAESRGLFGFSMGGFGALYHGFKHPEIFSCVFATGPGVIAPEYDLRNVMATWEGDEQFLAAYGGAFAQDLEKVPDFSGTAEDAGLITLWKNGFAQWGEKLTLYLAQPFRLKALALEWGDRDNYEWIVEGSRWMSKYLPTRGVAVQAQEFKGGHRILPERMSISIIPFFLKHLSFQ